MNTEILLQITEDLDNNDASSCLPKVFGIIFQEFLKSNFAQDDGAILTDQLSRDRSLMNIRQRTQKQVDVFCRYVNHETRSIKKLLQQLDDDRQTLEALQKEQEKLSFLHFIRRIEISRQKRKILQKNVDVQDLGIVLLFYCQKNKWGSPEFVQQAFSRYACGYGKK